MTLDRRSHRRSRRATGARTRLQVETDVATSMARAFFDPAYNHRTDRRFEDNAGYWAAYSRGVARFKGGLTVDVNTAPKAPMRLLRPRIR